MGKTYKRNKDGAAKVKRARKAAQARKAQRRLEDRQPEDDS